MKVIIIILLGVVIAFFLLGRLGLSLKPAPFPPFSSQQPSKPQTVPLPKGLPAPVEKFYRATYGNDIPVIKTAVISGRGTIQLFNLTFPLRFRSIHEAGQNFRSDMDITFFGFRVMMANEIFVDGVGMANTPAGMAEGDWFNQSSNIRMWAEVLEWFPSVLVTDTRVRWRPIDDNTASLTVPYEDGAVDHFVVRFNPETHKLQYIEAMKYKNAGNKALWINGIWMDDGKPWLHLDVEDTIYNADVKEYLRKSPKEE